jgi:DNA-binding transcriptional LysR family regulator
MATVHGHLPAITAEPDGLLRLGCDPLHCHLLALESPGLMAWHPLSRWGELLRQGEIDGALVSVAGMAAEGAGADAETTGGHRPGSGPCLDRTSCGHAVTLLPLGSRPLVLIHAPGGPCARDQSPRPWQLLLPPVGHQPQLWRELQRLDLLPLRDCSADDCESWLQALLQGLHLLPAHLSLLEQLPWREAGLKAVPPPEPLEESLWLLVREGEEAFPAIEALSERLQQRLLEGCRGMEPMV